MLLRQIITILGCLAGLYLSPVAAQQALASDATLAASQFAQKRGVLFKITGAKHTLFLFGTLHVGKPEFYPLEPIAARALAQSSKIALEIDPLNTEPVQQMITQYGQFPPGASLKLAPELQRRLEAILKKQGLSFDAISSMKPWMVTLLLTVNEFTARGYKPELGSDSYLASAARAANKPLVELENARDQLALFGQLSMADQVRFLEETITEIEDGRSEQKMTQLTVAWATADVARFDALGKEMAADTSFSGKFLQTVLLNSRNSALADGIEALLKSETQAFAGIGALHLVGKGSVPALLRQRGYGVERVY